MPHQDSPATVDKAVTSPTTPKAASSPATRRRTSLTVKQREASFTNQMSHIAEDLSPKERVFSRLIHIKPLETLSDLAASTVFRPNAMLAGSIAAFLVVTALYVTAKQLGYALSGFETIAAFGVGWALGLAYDYLRLLVRGKRS